MEIYHSKRSLRSVQVYWFKIILFFLLPVYLHNLASGCTSFFFRFCFMYVEDSQDYFAVKKLTEKKNDPQHSQIVYDARAVLRYKIYIYVRGYIYYVINLPCAETWIRKISHSARGCRCTSAIKSVASTIKSRDNWS